MNKMLFLYRGVDTVTWVYLSSLLSISLFFKFNRLWSVRNVDLIALILTSPGFLMIEFGAIERDQFYQQWGYIWLFVAGGIFLLRMLLDSTMVRRPLLEPNLSLGGLTFIGASLLVFLIGNVLVGQVPQSEDLAGAKRAEQLRARQEGSAEENQLAQRGPGYPLVFLLPTLSNQKIFGKPTEGPPKTAEEKADMQQAAYVNTARTVSILSNLAIVFLMVFIGYRHFDNVTTGIAAAVLYMLLPYTALYLGSVDHVLPAALIVGAVAAYRRPLVSGMLMGLAIGTFYYPLFLLPLWCSFYWQLGLLRFVAGVLSMTLVLVGVLALTSTSVDSFLDQVRQMFGWIVPRMNKEFFKGFWHLDFNNPQWRMPVLAAFGAMCATLAIWPAQKNLGTLMSCSAAVMLGAQFWHANNGGLYMAWYLPLMLLTIFRPNLEDRVALTVLAEGWPFSRKPLTPGLERAA